MTRANDTDKTWPNPPDPAKTEFDTVPTATAVRDATDPDGPPTMSTMDEGTGEHGADLLAGLRRQRPPPKVAPRTLAASDGDAAAAYYASPRDVAPRVKTMPPAPAVEIAETRSPPMPPVQVANVVNDESRSLPTVVARPRGRERIVAWASLGIIAVAAVVALVIVREGGVVPEPPPTPSTKGSEMVATPPVASSAPAPIVQPAPTAPAVVTSAAAPPPTPSSEPVTNAARPSATSKPAAVAASAPVRVAPPSTVPAAPSPPPPVPSANVPPPRDDSARVL